MSTGDCYQKLHAQSCKLGLEGLHCHIKPLSLLQQGFDRCNCLLTWDDALLVQLVDEGSSVLAALVQGLLEKDRS